MSRAFSDWMRKRALDRERASKGADPTLPDGLWRRDGLVLACCALCGKHYEFTDDTADFVLAEARCREHREK